MPLVFKAAGSKAAMGTIGEITYYLSECACSITVSIQYRNRAKSLTGANFGELILTLDIGNTHTCNLGHVW